MTRNRKSAKAAGTRFERQIADYLRVALDCDHIARKARSGRMDTGDVGGVRAHGQRVVVECKDVATVALPAWIREAQAEAVNDGALVGVVAHKRRGVSDPAQQWVSMTLADLAALITGDPSHWKGRDDHA